MSQKLGSSLLKQASERQISSLRWVPGAAFRNPWNPDLPCLSGFLLMTLSWVGSRVLAPGKHQGLFQWVRSWHQVGKVLELQLQHQSFQWIVRVDFLYDLLVWSPCSPRDSQVFSSTTDRRHQFYGTQPFLLSSSHIRTWLLEKPQQWIQTFAGKVMSLLFNMPSRFVIAFLLRNTHLLISWLRSLSTDFGAQEKVCHCFHCFPIFCHDVIREM